MNTEQAIREALTTNDLTLWSASGAHVFNSDTAIRDLARSVEVRLAATPAPREDGWEELRREIEALKADRGDAEWDTVARQEVLAIVDRLAAARGEPGIDVERLARALKAVDKQIVTESPETAVELNSGEVETGRRDYAIAIVAIYNRLATPTTPEPDQ